MAVVLYGGASLAVYINGVVQELFELARAAAEPPPKPGAPLRTIDVYRKLCQIVAQDRVEPTDPAPIDDVQTRFVIDVLSGTSAGGINAIFLAKALSGRTALDAVKRIWIEEGDFAVLLNDRASVRRLPLDLQDPPESLLNGRRMFLKLRDAFAAMDESPGPAMSDEIDLFVTATDIRGSVVPLRLADRVVYERRHRHVFHFRYAPAEQRDDFSAKMNSHLAFAARTTSAVPFAFEPTMLADADQILTRAGADAVGSESTWLNLLETEPRPTQESRGQKTPGEVLERLKTVSFGDGGYLDNKPFSYAIDALQDRTAALPVTRKLIYVEPSPEDVMPAGSDPTERVDPIQNTFAASFGLPRYETIREDLERVIARNRLVERLEWVTRDLDQDLAVAGKGTAPERLSGEDFAAAGLASMIGEFGPSYGGYHRLKVASTTDDLATLITNTAGFDDASDEFLAVRYLVRAWRVSHYAEEAAAGKETDNAFLLRFDLSHRIRRIEHLQRRLNFLHCADERAWEILERVPRLNDFSAAQNDTGAFQAKVREVRVALDSILTTLKEARRVLWAPSWSRSGDDELREVVIDTGFTYKDLDAVLAPRRDQDRLAAADEMVRGRDAQVKPVFDLIEKKFAAIFRKASVDLQRARESPRGSAVGDIIAHSLEAWFRGFESYDILALPLLYHANVGEPDRVDVLRISPRDAKSLIDERVDPRQKLAGVALMHFGAFLDARWRRNDILWGRLDAAERILDAFLPDDANVPGQKHPLYARYLKDLQEAILREEFEGDPGTPKAIADAVLSYDRTSDAQQTMRDWAEGRLGKAAFRTAPTGIVARCLDKADLHRFFKKSYEVDRDLDRAAMLELARRAATVTSRVLEGVSQGDGARYKAASPLTSWFSRITQIVTVVAAAAIPQSYLNLVTQHLLGLIILFELFCIVGGTLLRSPTTTRLGIIALTVTTGLALILSVVANWVGGVRLRMVLARLAPLVAGVTLAYIVAADRFCDLPRGSLIPIELARQVSDAVRAFSAPGVSLWALRCNTWFDFGFIVLYVMLIPMLAARALHNHPALAPRTTVLVGIGAILTGVMDLVENRGLFMMFSAFEERALPSALLEGVREASLAKWALFYLTVAVLAYVALLGRRVVTIVAATLFAAAAVVGIIGTAGAGWRGPEQTLSVPFVAYPFAFSDLVALGLAGMALGALWLAIVGPLVEWLAKTTLRLARTQVERLADTRLGRRLTSRTREVARS